MKNLKEGLYLYKFKNTENSMKYLLFCNSKEEFYFVNLRFLRNSNETLYITSHNEDFELLGGYDFCTTRLIEEVKKEILKDNSNLISFHGEKALYDFDFYSTDTENTSLYIVKNVTASLEYSNDTVTIKSTRSKIIKKLSEGETYDFKTEDQDEFIEDGLDNPEY